MKQKLEPFKEVIMQSPAIKKLIGFLNGQQYWGPVGSIYSITNYLIGTIEELKGEDFSNLYMYIKLLFEQKILSISGGCCEYRDEYGKVYINPAFYIIATDEKHSVTTPLPKTKSINYFDYEDMPF